MTQTLLCLSLFAAAAVAAATDAPPEPTLPYLLPARMQHHQFFVDARAPSGQVLHLFTDTGGGMNLAVTGADKLGIAYSNGGEPGPEGVLGSTTWPAYAAPWIPPPRGGLPESGLPILRTPPGMDFDGMLGAAWHGGRTWEWDYRRGTLRLLPDGTLPRVAPDHQVALGFQRGGDGTPTTHFPRIQARVDGADLQFLFDTGATFRLQEAAAEMLGDAAVRQRAGSFITRSVLQRWRAAHPEWRYLERGDGEAAMIEVPQLEVAGYTTGPVWFAERPDRAFHVYMAQWMDAPVDGALGGNAFRGFRITVDYPSAQATFER